MSRAPHEAAEEQRGEQVDHHDHPVHGDELVVVLGRDEAERVREAELHAHHHGHRQRDEPDRDSGQRVLDGDDLVVLAPDVLRDESLRIVQVGVLIRDRYIGHQPFLPLLAAAGRTACDPTAPCGASSLFASVHNVLM
jgi:hypothetical protein